MFPLSGQKEKIAASRLSFIRAIGPVRREREVQCYLLTSSVFVGFLFFAPDRYLVDGVAVNPPLHSLLLSLSGGKQATQKLIKEEPRGYLEKGNTKILFTVFTLLWGQYQHLSIYTARQSRRKENFLDCRISHQTSITTLLYYCQRSGPLRPTRV